MFENDEKKFLHSTGGLYPPEKPSFTLHEDMLSTITSMRETIDRMLKFEVRVENKVSDLMSKLTSDNVLFKDTFNNAYKLFLQEVKNEVNLFESNVDNTVKLFGDNLKSDYENLDTDMQGLIAENLKTYDEKLKEFETTIFNSFKEKIESIVENNSTASAESSANFQRKLTTELNMFEADVNTAIRGFTTSMTDSFKTFKTTWTEIVENRLDTQDQKIANAENYMKTNLEATVRTELGDMYDSGDFAEILEGEVFKSIQDKMNEIENDVNSTMQATANNVEKRVENVESRIDNIIATNDSATEGNAELLDIRVGADGVTYPTAGEAVREQFTNVNNGLNILCPYNLDDNVFRVGDITITDGKYNYIINNKRVSTVEGLEIPLNEGDVIKRSSAISRFNLAYRDNETGELTFVGWQYDTYVVEKTADYVFVLSRVENIEGTDIESDVANKTSFSRGLSIISSNRLSDFCKWWYMDKEKKYTFTLPTKCFRNGSITITNNELDYIDDIVRVSTVEGLEIPLNEGDVIKCSSAISRFNLAYRDNETGELTFIGWQYGNYIIEKTSNYVFVLSRVENDVEIAPENISDFTNDFCITTSNEIHINILQEMINVISTPKINEFEQEKMEKMSEINNKVHNCIEGDSLVFVHFSDTHSGTYPMTLDKTKDHMSTAIKLGECVNADFIIHTGDIIQGDGSTSGEYGVNDKDRYKAIKEGLHSNIPFIFAVGNNNHDCGITTENAYLLSKNQICNYVYNFGSHLTANANYNKDDTIKSYFYFDNEFQKTRIIVLDTSDYGENRLSNGCSTIQEEWVIETLTDAKDKNYGVIVFAHMPSHDGLMPNYPPLDNVKTALTNFTTNGGKILAYVHGHLHWDNYFYDVDTKIPFICVTSDQPVEQTESFIPLGSKIIPDREVNTLLQYAYDVYVINTKTGKTNIFRYGAGTDRIFEY